MKYEVRLSGTGGQGLVLAGIILGEAAAIYENLYAAQKQSYGAEARGGASRSDVIISDSEIEYTVIDEPDILLAMSQESFDKYAKKVKENGIIIIDRSLVSVGSIYKEIKLYALDLTRSATKVFNMPIVANIIALGAVATFMGVVTEDSLRKVLKKRVPSRFLSINERALALGISLSKEG